VSRTDQPKESTVTDEPPFDSLDDLLRLVMTAAHAAFLDEQRTNATGATCTRRAVEEAFRCAVTNGIVTIVPRDHWATFVTVTPPYLPWERSS
jgi:hypothetical protein